MNDLLKFTHFYFSCTTHIFHKGKLSQPSISPVAEKHISPRRNLFNLHPTSISLTSHKQTKCDRKMFHQKVEEKKKFPRQFDILRYSSWELKLEKKNEGKLKVTQWGQTIVPKMSELLSHCVFSVLTPFAADYK